MVARSQGNCLSLSFGSFWDSSSALEGSVFCTCLVGCLLHQRVIQNCQEYLLFVLAET